MDEMNHPSSEGESRETPSNPQTPKQPFPAKLVAIIATVCIVVVGLVALLTLIKPSDDSSSSCNHQWIEADCLYPKTCRICQETTGDAKGHSFINATCTEPKVCQNCNKTDGKALGHTEVVDASVEPTCTTKGLTEGKHCSVCNAILVQQTEINKLGHDWGNPTCTTPRSCLVCFAVDPNSEPMGHSYMQGECIICGADDPDYIALTLTSTKYNISLKEDSDVAYITMIGGETVTYDIDDTSVVSCEWGEWDGDVIPLTFHPISNGQTFVTVYIDNTNIKIVIDITVDSQQNIKLQQMAALGIETAYNSAKFPSTLRLSRVTYEDRINGYGDPITRMVIECYATNSFGGYGYIYVVVLCCEYETDYINYEWDGLYFSTSAYNNSPGLCNYILDNGIAMSAYKKLTSNPKDIPYD